MKFSALVKFAVLANVFAASLVTVPSVKASTFEEKEIDQRQVVAIAAPYRHGYNLVIIEQVPGKDKCWSEQGIAPVAVDALLMNFDFSGHCNRATDSNGYSVRLGGEERGSDFLLKIVEQDHELLLVATQRDPKQPPLILGRTGGKSDGITKIFLNPGWRFTKRSYQGKELGHFYLSDSAITYTSPQQVQAQEVSVTTTVKVTPVETATSTTVDRSTP